MGETTGRTLASALGLCQPGQQPERSSKSPYGWQYQALARESHVWTFAPFSTEYERSGEKRDFCIKAIGNPPWRILLLVIASPKPSQVNLVRDDGHRTVA